MPVVAPAPPANHKGQQAAPMPLVPFVRASRQGAEPFIDTSALLGTALTTVSDQRVPAFGFLRSILLYVTCTGGTGAAAVYQADAPYNVLRDVTLMDANGRPLVGPVDGYDLRLLNKWCGWTYDGDPAVNPVLAVPTTGNFSFILRIPVEVSERDGLGALPNSNAAEAYKLGFNFNTAASVFSVNPTTLPTVRVRAWAEYWAPPAATDLRGNPQQTTPPAVQTTETISKATPAIAVGDQRIRMTRTGGFIRYLIFQTRDAGGARIDSVFPDTFRLELDQKLLFNLHRDIQRTYMREHTGYAVDTGVIVIDFEHDLDGKNGYGMRDQWLPTTTATRLELVGVFNAGIVSMSVMTVDVQPAGNVFAPVNGY